MVSYYYFIIWILCWFLGWGGLYHIPEKKRDYVKNFLVVTLYFCVVSFIVMYLFRGVIDPVLNKITFVPAAILIIFFVMNFLVYFFSNKFLKKPVKLLEKYSSVSYLHLDYRYLLSKSFEIFFQQILIVSLVFMLNNQGLNLFWITVIFVLMFGFGHIPVIRLQRDFFGYLVFAAGLISSFLFPYLILSFQWGFIYTYILHWLFYTNSGVLSWVVNSDYFEKFMHKTVKTEKKIIEEVGK